ncbi:hypothetical protein CAPTEDRAFT_214267 [Capitella teleta]|uniref:Copper transport protein n=1 Tax=Capitella teleta TaxID=283909 RepID=R7VKX9_CAPTE|nr:hypothetical protein CAPTEDRAFT_214267 [Capitella teleta]|eukprot:ELU17145.1 hypothetical protein CAPTEDRAFT_214267 [Capitella teleta]
MSVTLALMQFKSDESHRYTSSFYLYTGFTAMKTIWKRLYLYMHNHFHWTNRVSILVKDLDVERPLALLGVAIAFVFLSAFDELLKCLRLWLAEKQTKKVAFLWSHFVQTMLHVFNISVGYLLMLIVMSYNIWVLIAVVVGAALGRLIGYVATGGHPGLVIRESRSTKEQKDDAIEMEPWVKMTKINNNVMNNADSLQLVASV